MLRMLHLSQDGTHLHKLSHEGRYTQEENKRFEAHTIEENDQEEEERTKEDEDSYEEYVLISTLTGSISPGNDTWIVDSGASRNMKGYKDSLSCIV